LDILAENRINSIDIMGGEPFLVPWISDFVEAGLSKGMSLNISTNGSIPGVFHRFRGISHDHFNIGISLEGSTTEKHNRLTGSDNFERAIESLKKLIGFSLDPIVKTVFNRETEDDIQNIVDLVRESGETLLYHPDGHIRQKGHRGKILSTNAFSEFHQKIRRENPDIEVHRVNASCFEKNSLPPGVRCAGGVRKLSVLPDGAVFPCNLFHHMKGFELGNIFRDCFNDIWSDPRLDLFRRYQGNRCSMHTCKNQASCTGGCPAHGYYHYGDPDVADIRCIRTPACQPATDNPRL
jgi:radical SAM protein with 4Fe4S-binding SPASM domain